MKGRWNRARAWAVLTETLDGDPVLLPVPWRTAARAWVLVYLSSTFIMASIFFTAETLTGEGSHWAAWVLAPMFGCAAFIGTFVGSRRPTRSARTARRQRIPTETSALIIASVVLSVVANVADRFVPQAAGWAHFGMSVGLTTLACAVFVAVTHMRSHRARSA